MNTSTSSTVLSVESPTTAIDSEPCLAPLRVFGAIAFSPWTVGTTSGVPSPLKTSNDSAAWFVTVVACGLPVLDDVSLESKIRPTDPYRPSHR